MRFFFALLILTVLLLLGGSLTGVVGFHYPSITQNEPLKNPQKVLSIHGAEIVLQNGRVVRIDDADISQISNKLSQAAFEIDLEGGDHGGAVGIYGRQNGWVCGTPWAKPIRIPLIRDRVYKNRRQLIALGWYVQSQSQAGGANGSSETDQIPSADLRRPSAFH